MNIIYTELGQFTATSMKATYLLSSQPHIDDNQEAMHMASSVLTFTFPHHVYYN